MSSWPVQDAKSRFSELLENCLKHGPQVVTTQGEETAVLVPIDEWRRIQSRAEPTKPSQAKPVLNKPTLKELLLADEPRFDFDLPKRTGFPGRRIPDFD